MKPFKVNIALQGPMIEPKALFHLDGLLSALKVAQSERDGVETDPREIHHDLPLERYCSPSGEWCFKASAFTLHKETEPTPWTLTSGVSPVTSAEHRASGVLRHRPAKPNLAGGPFKKSIYYEPIVWASLSAYGIGDIEGIRALLAICHQVGSRRGTGMGNVESIDVIEIPPEECLWQYRALPADSDTSGLTMKEYAPAIGHIRAPYWDRTEHREILHPIW